MVALHISEEVRPIDALKSSVQAVKKTWGESLIRYYGLGLVQGALIIVGLLLFGLPGVLMVFAGSWTAVWILLGLFILWAMIVSLIFSRCGKRSVSEEMNNNINVKVDIYLAPQKNLHAILQKYRGFLGSRRTELEMAELR